MEFVPNIKYHDDISKELQQLNQLNVFPQEELKDIVQKLVFHQDRITSEHNLSYYMEYIEYRLQLLQNLQQYALEVADPNTEAAEWLLITKIKLSYQNTILEFTHDHSLYIPYIKFCIKVDSTDDIVEWCITFIENNINTKVIWNILDELYSSESEDIKTSMWMIMRDLAAKYVPRILERQPTNGLDGEDIRIKKLGDLFSSAFTYIRCSYFHIALLDNIKDESILKLLLDEFSQNIYMWSALAQRLWRVDIKADPDSELDTTRCPKIRLQQCISKYKEGISQLLPENKAGLWCIFINFLFFVYEDPDIAVSQSFRLSMIKTHLIEGMPYFSESQFLQWLEIEENQAECLRISERAVAILPKSVSLWSERLRFEFFKPGQRNTRSIFDVAIDHLKDESLPIWLDMVQYTLLTSTPDQVEKLFMEAAKCSPPISSKMRPKFLEWLSLRKGMKHVRAVFNLLVEMEPHTKEMHETMSRLETLLTTEFDEEIAERVHIIALERYPADMDVRLSYMRFLTSLSTRRTNNNLTERVKKALDDCYASLPSNLHELFKTKYADIVTSTGVV